MMSILGDPFFYIILFILYVIIDGFLEGRLNYLKRDGEKDD